MASPAGSLAGSAQFGPGTGGESLHADRVEHLGGGTKLVPGVAAAALAPQPLAVHEVRTGEVGMPPGAAQPVDRFAVVPLGGFSFARQRARACLDPKPNVGFSGPGRCGEQIQGIGGAARVSGAYGSFD